MRSTPVSSRPPGQASRATRRLGDDPLDRNMVIRCSDALYEAARTAAAARSESLSDYVRHLIIRDMGRRRSDTGR
jgi:hypothetical protein